MSDQRKINWENLALRLSSVFQPSAPINSEKLFRGRTLQVRTVVDTINQPGRHAILFGGRGVGKTSLGKTIREKLSTFEPIPIISPYITSDSMDDYSSIWRKAFIEMRYQSADEGAPQSEEEYDPIEDTRIQWTPFEVRRTIEPFSKKGLLYVVFDEFDKVEDSDARQLLADTIKLFSDHAVKATLIVIGVSDDATGLIDDHRSIERCLAQIPMPRMKREELDEIVEKGLEQLGMTIGRDALREITGLSSGLPTYAHLLGLHAGREAVDRKSLEVNLRDVKRAITIAVSHSEESIRGEYDKATFSPRETLHAQVLLACAMATTDEYGRFVPNDVCGPMKLITGKDFKSDRFAAHLKQFCEKERSAVLRKTGTNYRWRYQFTNPLLQPYVIMKGLDAGLIKEEQLNLGTDEDDHPLFRH